MERELKVNTPDIDFQSESARKRVFYRDVLNRPEFSRVVLARLDVLRMQNQGHAWLSRMTNWGALRLAKKLCWYNHKHGNKNFKNPRWLGGVKHERYRALIQTGIAQEALHATEEAIAREEMLRVRTSSTGLPTHDETEPAEDRGGVFADVVQRAQDTGATAASFLRQVDSELYRVKSELKRNAPGALGIETKVSPPSIEDRINPHDDVPVNNDRIRELVASWSGMDSPSRVAGGLVDRIARRVQPGGEEPHVDEQRKPVHQGGLVSLVQASEVDAGEFARNTSKSDGESESGGIVHGRKLDEDPLPEAALHEGDSLPVSTTGVDEFDARQRDEERISTLAEREDIEDVVRTYLTYPGQTYNRAALLAQKPRTFLYAEALLHIKNSNRLPELESVVSQLHTDCIGLLHSFGITDITPYTNAKTWAYWDCAKNFYDFTHPEQADVEYPIADPLLSERKQMEILNRMLAWEILLGGDSPERQEVRTKIKYTSHESDIPSWELSLLGDQIQHLPIEE